MLEEMLDWQDWSNDRWSRDHVKSNESAKERCNSYKCPHWARQTPTYRSADAHFFVEDCYGDIMWVALLDTEKIDEYNVLRSYVFQILAHLKIRKPSPLFKNTKPLFQGYLRVSWLEYETLIKVPIAKTIDLEKGIQKYLWSGARLEKGL